jgi:hypothetical protein
MLLSGSSINQGIPSLLTYKRVTTHCDILTAPLIAEAAGSHLLRCASDSRVRLWRALTSPLRNHPVGEPRHRRLHKTAEKGHAKPRAAPAPLRS